MPEQRKIVVAGQGSRQTSKGPIHFINDLDGNEYATWSGSVIPGAVPNGTIATVTFETTRRPRNDGGFFENHKLLYVELPPQAEMAAAPAVTDGAFSSPTAQVQERELRIMRQTAGKCAANLVGGLYSGTGYGHTQRLALMQVADMLLDYFETGLWEELTPALAQEEIEPDLPEVEDDIPFDGEPS